MTGVNAFVGHSFEKQDEEVVRTFLDFFDSLKRSPIGFSWVNAKPAQAMDVGGKVIPLIRASNLFIGICTKKERALPDEALRHLWVSRSHVLVPNTAIEWKTSDWIIQEIGLAFGLGLKLILLLENGVRRPGSLQGNIEYVQFPKEAPQQAFGRITDMIGALTAETSTALVAAPDAATGAGTAVAVAPAVIYVESWTAPQATWTRNDYEISFIHFALEGDEEGMRKIDTAYLMSDDAAKSKNRTTWVALSEYWKIELGKNPNLSKLEEIAEAHPASEEIQVYFAKAIHTYGGYEKAAGIYEKAAAACSKTEEIVRLKGHAATEYVHAEKPSEVRRLTDEIRSIANDGGVSELQALRVLANIAKLQNTDQLELGLLERIVDIEPGDTDSRFALAFKYSGVKADELSLFHYQRIPVNQRTATTWNNIGVAFGRLSMEAKCVDAYRSSERLGGEGLALSNLGSKFVAAGFHDEGKKLFHDALGIEGMHKENAWQGLTNLKEVKDKETEIEREALAKAKERSEFYKAFGRAIALPEMSQLLPLWKGPKCNVVVALADGTFAASGEYERPVNALTTPFGLGLLGGAVQKKTGRVRVTYTGVVHGRTIEGHVRTTVDGAPLSLLGAALESTGVLMTLDDAGIELRVMELQVGGAVRLYSLTSARQELPAPAPG